MTRVSVAVVCDLAPDRGVGHAMRCAALAEELIRRGLDVAFIIDPSAVPWVTSRIRATGGGIQSLSHDSTLPAALVDAGFAAVVFDSYLLDPQVYAGTRAAGLVTLAFVDDDLRGASADLLLDQNIGAEEAGGPAGSTLLGGLRYAVLRDAVVARRPDAPHVRDRSATPRVLAFLGGTDPSGATPDLLRLIVESQVPCEVTVIGARPELVAELEAIRPAAGQRIDVIGPSDRLDELMASSDVVLCAAGSSLWEVCALGRAAAVLCVADNQRPAFDRLVAQGVAASLGSLEELRADPTAARAAVARLLHDASYADGLSAAAWRLVDGLGKERVVDALLTEMATVA